MIERWKLFGDLALAVREPDGDYVEYADHLAAIAEKDKEIERLQTNIDVMKRALRWSERALRWSEWEEDGDGGKERIV